MSVFSQPEEVEDFQLVMFIDETKLIKEKRNNVVTVKNICVRFFVTFFLRNKKFIVYIQMRE